MFEKIIKLLNEANNISIYSHVNTDCDAMGSSLAQAVRHMRNVAVISVSFFMVVFFRLFFICLIIYYTS
jgi:nanoRNase/pAp phosphatase (c-di-AMP/oligoRNAs hydrolase)